MIPVNSVLQVGSFPEVMQAEINRSLKTVQLINPHEPVPAGSYEAILTRSNTPIPESLLRQIPQSNRLLRSWLRQSSFRLPQEPRDSGKHHPGRSQ
jgi:hypothetical protein